MVLDEAYDVLTRAAMWSVPIAEEGVEKPVFMIDCTMPPPPGNNEVREAHSLILRARASVARFIAFEWHGYAEEPMTLEMTSAVTREPLG
jgi:hypothetical protein